VTVLNKTELEQKFIARGFEDFRWLDPKNIVVGQWVRMKCLFGCWEYGRNAACPPEVPSVADCERFFREYRTVAVFHFQAAMAKPEDRHAWTKPIDARLLDLERELFLAGHYKAFLLPMDSCALCEPCTGRRTTCKEPKKARPTPDSLAMDVYATVRSIGYPIEVLYDYKQAMNRYAFLFID
jgi:predicted metal-binding protein